MWNTMKLCKNSFYEPSITLIMKPSKITAEKLHTYTLNGHRCKDSQHNTSKQNPKPQQKCASGSSYAYPRNATMNSQKEKSRKKNPKQPPKIKKSIIYRTERSLQ